MPASQAGRRRFEPGQPLQIPSRSPLPNPRNQPGRIRLTGGEFSGRLIQGPAGEGVRPTSSMVRKALFDSLGDIQRLNVLDVFSGTGALGVEALSRGADRAVFVDRNAETIRTNVKNLGLEDRSRVIEAEAQDALGILAREGGSFGLVLMD